MSEAGLGWLNYILNPDVTDGGPAGDAVVYTRTIKERFFSFSDILPVKLSLSLL